MRESNEREHAPWRRLTWLPKASAVQRDAAAYFAAKVRAEASKPKPAAPLPLTYRQAQSRLADGSRLLAASAPAARRRGMLAVHALAADCGAKLHDPKLAARIYDGYLLPHILDAPADPAANVSRDQLLREAGGVYDDARRLDMEAAAYRSLFAVTASQHTADLCAVCLANIYAPQKRYKDALYWLAQIKLPDMSSARTFIPEIQKLAQSQGDTKK